MLKLWTIGREREKLHAAKFVRDDEQQLLLFPVIDAVHDLIEGVGDPTQFAGVARHAMIEGGYGVWTNTANWIRQVGNRLPNTLEIWSDLSKHDQWKVRWRVACSLYLDIPELESDRLFAVLRSDKSKKVRDYAIARYEVRPDPTGLMGKRFDASNFDERVRSGKVSL